MPTTKISVIVPVHNKQDYLKDCIASVIDQGIGDLEIICIDDASTDGSRRELLSLADQDERIIVLSNSANQGVGPSRNHGIYLARGEYIVFLDADDRLAENSLFDMLKDLETHEQNPPDMIKGVIREFYAGRQGYNSELMPFNNEGMFNPREEKYFWTPWYHTSYIYRTSFLRENRILYPNLCEGEDPVFLAEAISNVERILARRVDFYHVRRGHETAYRITLRHLRDCISHIDKVKNIQLEWLESAWYEGYKKHCLRTYVNHFASLFESADLPSIVQDELMAALLEVIQNPPLSQ